MDGGCVGEHEGGHGDRELVLHVPGAPEPRLVHHNLLHVEVFAQVQGQVALRCVATARNKSDKVET